MPDIFVNKDHHTKEHHTPEKKIHAKLSHTPEISDSFFHSPLSSFYMYPPKMKFETQELDEKIILLLRQHPIVNLKWILITILMSQVPAVVAFLGVFESFPAGFSFVIGMGWYLITLAYALESFLSWYFNVYFVTDRRIIDVDFYNIIYKQVSDAQLDKIQDLTYNMGGVIRTLFNYGNVFIQTAGEVNQFEFNAVPYPDRVAKIIQDLITP